MLDVRRMRVLREVAVRGSFSAAAEALSFTQSAVSQQIAALEREAGTTLVQRSARGVRLTEAGEAVVRHAEAIMARLAEAEAELEAIAGLRGGRLRMAAFESAGATLMPLAIAAFRQQHPAVELSMSMSEPEDCVPLLRSGELDLGDRLRVGGLARRRRHPPRPPARGPDVPRAARATTRWPTAAACGWRDLAGEAWIGGQPDCECNRLISRACAVAGYEPRIAFETDDYTAMQGFVAAGVGVSLIAELGLTTVRDDIVVRDLGRDTPVRQIYAATLAEGYRSPATQAMLEILRDVASRYESRRPRLELVG